MDVINFGSSPVPGPTICGPVSDFEKLTLSENCIRMGEYGAIAGFVAAMLFWIGFYYVGPRVVIYGRLRGWWS